MAESVISNLFDSINDTIRGARLIDWVAHESPGITVDEATAIATPCKVFDIGDGKKMYFSQGVIGALDQNQVEKYCKGTIQEESPELRERVRKFREASDVCVSECKTLPKGDRLSCRLNCMSIELGKRGIRV